ncbi:MAG: hypothetical protein LBS28_03685, partial [Streptococcaceae bacterium]|nr:hypothetical protein [Streptococcaceae bacterium]
LLPEHKLYNFDDEEGYLKFMHGFYLLMTGKEKGRQMMMDIICKFLISGNRLVATQLNRLYDDAIIKLHEKKKESII